MVQKRFKLRWAVAIRHDNGYSLTGGAVLRSVQVSLTIVEKTSASTLIFEPVNFEIFAAYGTVR